MSATKIVVTVVGVVAVAVLGKYLWDRQKTKEPGEPEMAPVAQKEPLRLTHQKETSDTPAA